MSFAKALAQQGFSPVVRNVLLFLELWSGCEMNVMPDFVKQHLPEGEILDEPTPRKATWKATTNLVHKELYICRLSSPSGLVVAASLQHRNLLPATPSFLSSLSA